MYGRKISCWLLHLGLLFVVLGAIISWRTVRSDRAFLRPYEPLILYGLTFENRGDLYINGDDCGLLPFRPVMAGGWKVQFLESKPDGTMVIQLRSDPYGETLVFAGYMLFALGSAWFIGLFPLLGVGAVIGLVSLYQPVNPALRSGWFAVHVGLIAVAYLCFLILPWRRSMALLTCGVCLLGLGIASGSVWGASAWGRYWGWDPKELGALLMLLLYCLPLHFPAIAVKRWPYWLPLLLLPLLMLLPGLHSYLFT